MDSIIAMRKEHLRMQAQAMASADLSSPSAVIQQAQTLASIARPDELVPESRNAMLNMVDTLVSAGSSQDSSVPLQPSTGSVLLGVVGGAVFSSIQSSQIAARSSSRLLLSVSQVTGRGLSAADGSSVQQDAKAASERMTGIVQSMSTSLMRGAVSGEEPVVVNSTMVSLAVARIGSESNSGMSVSSPAGATLVIPSNPTDAPVDVRAVSWTNNPVRVCGG
jgi:hypothetical protein